MAASLPSLPRLPAAAVCLLAAGGMLAAAPPLPGEAERGPRPAVPRDDHPGLAGTALQGSEQTDLVFIIDGSGSIGSTQFAFELDALQACIAEQPADGSVAVAVIQFADSAVVELPLTVLDSAATQTQVLDTVAAISQVLGGTLLTPPLVTAGEIFENQAVGSTRRLVVVTDGGIADPGTSEAECEALRTMPVPVTICIAMLVGPCPPEDPVLLNCANACNAATFNPQQPVGGVECTLDLDEFNQFCADCGIGVCTAQAALCESGELDKITPLDPGQEDRFGNAVAIHGDVIVVGVKNDDDACPADPDCNSGSAYVFRFDGAQWVQEAKLTAFDAAAGDQFGFSVGVSGDTALVGAPGNDLAGSGSGAAYVFGRNESGPDNWGLVALLAPAELAGGDNFGSSVDVSGNIAVVGAPGRSDVALDAGAAYVFSREQGGGDNWGQVQRLDTQLSLGVLDRFGTAVAVDGALAIVGAPGDESLGPNPGTAYVFERFGIAGWGLAGILTGETIVDDLGASVSISHDVAAVGVGTLCGCGPAGFTYRFDGTEWALESNLVALDVAEEDQFATSVAVDGDVAVVGARGESTGGFSAGAAFVYRFDGAEWGLDARVHASDGLFLDEFGASVAVSCERTAIGVVGDDDGGVFQSGSVYLFGGMSDCNDSVTLDLCDVADGSSADDDGDGLPDECGFFCCGSRIRVSQESAPGAGDFDDNPLGCLVPFQTLQSAQGFYSYNETTESYDGVALDPRADLSQLLLVQTVEGLTVVTLHDRAIPDDADGGRAEMRFELSGDPDGAFRSAEDDPPPSSDLYFGDPGDSLFEAAQQWNPCCTDGLGIGGLDGEWSLLVEFTEVDGDGGTAPVAGVSEWRAVSGDGREIPLSLAPDRRVLLEVVAPSAPCPWDCDDGDGTVGVVDFLGLLAQWGTAGACDFDGGGVGVTDFLDLLAHWGACP